jgi:hypothetical protein
MADMAPVVCHTKHGYLRQSGVIDGLGLGLTGPNSLKHHAPIRR